MNTKDVFDAIAAFAGICGATATHSKVDDGTITIAWAATYNQPPHAVMLPSSENNNFYLAGTDAVIRETRSLIAAVAQHRNQAPVVLIINNNLGFSLDEPSQYSLELRILVQSYNSRMVRCPPPADPNSWMARHPQQIFGWPPVSAAFA